jgi:translation initiation factor IF-3
MFKGRENAHHDRGRDILMEVMKELDEIAKVEKMPNMDSPRQMSLILTPR